MSIYRGLAPRNDNDDDDVKTFTTALRPRLLRHLAPTSVVVRPAAEATWPNRDAAKDERVIVRLASEAIVALIAIIVLVLSARAG